MSGQAGSNRDAGEGRGGGSAFGGDYIRDQFPATYDEYLAKKAGKQGDSEAGKFVTFDNELGEVTLRLPPQHQHYQAELLEDLYDEYFGAPAGDRKIQEQMNEFVAEWLRKKGALGA